jgi:hypothetical protein
MCVCVCEQIAFGEAGAEIIGKNLAAGDELNPMIRGRKVRTQECTHARTHARAHTHGPHPAAR